MAQNGLRRNACDGFGKFGTWEGRMEIFSRILAWLKGQFADARQATKDGPASDELVCKASSFLGGKVCVRCGACMFQAKTFYCQHCGAVMPEDTDICDRCGERQDIGAEQL